MGNIGILQDIFILVTLWQYTRSFSFLHSSLSSPGRRARLCKELPSSTCGALVGVTSLLEYKFWFHLSLYVFILDDIQYWGNHLASYLLPFALLCYINQLHFSVIFWHIRRYELRTKMFWATLQSSVKASWWQQRLSLLQCPLCV